MLFLGVVSFVTTLKACVATAEAALRLHGGRLLTQPPKHFKVEML